MKIFFKFAMSGLMALSLINAASAKDVTICDGIECEKKQIFLPSDEGSGLLDFDESSDKIKPAVIKPQNKVPFTGAAKKSLDLKWKDLSNGMCLTAPDSNAGPYYKVTKLEKDKRNKVVFFVIEAEDHQNTLKANMVFFNSSDSGAFRKLRKLPCDQTPHLYDNKYISKCLNGAKTGTHFCDFDSFLRK